MEDSVKTPVHFQQVFLSTPSHDSISFDFIQLMSSFPTLLGGEWSRRNLGGGGGGVVNLLFV